MKLPQRHVRADRRGGAPGELQGGRARDGAARGRRVCCRGVLGPRAGQAPIPCRLRSNIHILLANKICNDCVMLYVCSICCDATLQ